MARFSRWRRRGQAATAGTGLLVALGPVLAILTYFALGPIGQGAGTWLRLVLLADFVYVMIVAALVLYRVAQMVAARRARSAGSRLHLRLTGVFAFLALVPTVLVAVFAVLTVNTGLEGWFSERVRSVIGASVAAAEAYGEAEQRGLASDTLIIARVLNGERTAQPVLSDAGFDGQVRQILARVQPRIQRGLKEAFVIDSVGTIRARGASSYEFDYDAPTSAQFDALDSVSVLVIEDWEQNEFRALTRLSAFTDRYLYLSRTVDGEILTLLDETQETAQLYQQLESERGRLLFDFGLLYIGFAVVLILAATWAGLWFAERLSRPVGRLAGAAQRVGAGDLDVRVPEQTGDDEIAMLGRYFNQMTAQLKGQRQALLDNTAQIERRRRLFDSVLSSVSSGVVGVDSDGRIQFVNRSAERLLGLASEAESRPLTVAIPEFGALFEDARTARSGASQGEVRLTRKGSHEILLVRMATRRGEGDGSEGYVVAFEDVTSLVSAQRMAAWGDVARRIAHEIKNPLTPIQLSAERIKRKFGPKLGEESDQLDQMTDVIVRQTNDLRRIVDEFSKFARMPEPERRAEDLGDLVRAAVLLQENGNPHITYEAAIAAGPMPVLVDDTMISQALTNLLKNAAEAIQTRSGAGHDFSPKIRVALRGDAEELHLTIEDNGVGLPADRLRLFEPYVTSRAEGTGLGLPIVLKIIEEHDGSLTLSDAEPFDPAYPDHRGARADLRLPRTAIPSAVEDAPSKEAV
ncbi:MAG: PAS domain-containing sensor histidine kinase [Pseudomonadota bacterium]